MSDRSSDAAVRFGLYFTGLVGGVVAIMRTDLWAWSQLLFLFCTFGCASEAIKHAARVIWLEQPKREWD